LDLDESELRRLLLERRRSDRKQRLNAYKHHGEVIPVNAKRAESLEANPLAPHRIHADPSLKLKPPTTPRFRLIADRALLVIEFFAVIGLGYVFFNGVNLLNELNREVASAFQLDSSPTPLIGPVVLPSGHTPPNEGRPAQPNEAEIPEHLRPLVQAYSASIQVPTPGPGQALGIKIPQIRVNAPIVQGDGWEELKRGVGQHLGSAEPGQPGNLILSGHNDIYGEVFRHLDQLTPGDEITVFTANETYTYVVVDTLIVAPTFVQVLDQTPVATLTLISCYPYLVDTQRIVVLAELNAN
jgi:sortase A